MAKKSIIGNYRFDAVEKSVYVKGDIAQERFLLITNVTTGNIIYNFADSALGMSGAFYNSVTDETALSLIYDTSSMSDVDKLQIFYDEEYQEFTPAEDILDPVGKLRVSNPENLIDTDFEYGLQATKWETIQTVNNIPTIFNNSGDTPIDGLVSVEAVAGSKSIKVTTNIPHGLSIGDPISVQGVDQYQAQGFFIVTSSPTTTTFFFDLDVVASFSGDISGSYTTILPGKFFEGSSLPISVADGAVTSDADISTISVTTEETHGLDIGSKVYLRNTVGPKTLKIASSEATAPDGRPFVDTQATFTDTTTLDMQTSTGRGGFKDTPIVAYDWVSTYNKYLGPSEWDTVNDRVTWIGHNLRDGYALLFNTPYHSLSDGGCNDGTVFYVKVIDADTIELHNSTALTSRQNLTTLNNKYGTARLGLVYKVQGADATSRRTAFWNAIQALTVTSGRVGSTSTSTQTYNINLTTLFGSTPSTVILRAVQLAGDTNSTSENVTVTIAGQTQSLYTPGSQDNNLNDAVISPSGATPVFNDLDVTSSTFTSGGSLFLQVQARCTTAVGTFATNSRNRYDLAIRVSNGIATSGGLVSTDLTTAQLDNSGSDLLLANEQFGSSWGLGQVQPAAAIAFQNTLPTNTAVNSNDQFSSFANQRSNGRYGTLGVKNTNNNYSSAAVDGSFVINVFEGTNENYGSNSEIFYIFATPLSADRNTIYLQNHGLTDGQTVRITVDSTDYSAGDRFSFANSNGTVIDMPQSFDATVTVLNNSVFRIQTSQSPLTDDIARFPDNFTYSYQRPNETFNSIYINNHKITSLADSTYTNVSGTTIAPLVDGSTVTLARLNDNRLLLGGSGTGTAEITSVVERSNNSTLTDEFIDLETPSGFIPAAANITQVEFRGDFSGSNEYVTLTFSDGDSYIIGQFDDNGDTSTYTTSTTLTGKNISSLLTEQGGSVGFTISVTPQTAVNFGPGGGPWWGLRFTVETEEGTVVITSAGTGEKSFAVENLVGAYDGIFEMTDIPAPNTFDMSSDFRIPIRIYEFTSAQLSGSVITLSQDHNLITGEKVTYDENGNASILPSGIGETFAIVISSKAFKLASSEADAKVNNAISLSAPIGTHFIRSSNVIKAIKGAGTISVANGSKKVTGSGTNFLSSFKRFDKIDIDNGTYVEEFTVDTITSPETMTLFEASSANVSGADYYYITQLSLRPDGYSLHLPFDGGVDITAGTSPSSRIARQTRKYFRYQSGKGIQTSFAINFNPPRIVKVLIESAGSVATIITQEQHNLKVNDIITISNATVTTGTNFYNGTFPVTEIVDPFTFKYTMEGSPSDIKAGGFPTYVRAGWTDSYVRGGMFDDQNGFFYEYDGEKLYAVRRSSTKQIAGTVNVTRGSQVVSGTGTSFTTQLRRNDRLVLRGQTYFVTEVSSDSRIVVQPAYRGIDARNVKATITQDVRTAQEDWNLDKADGTGFTRFNLDITKIQMAYMDYSWYGAGKIRYGFKDNKGHIRYMHEYIHNNKLDESYFRSGNLPARYEIENGRTATTSPTLFHFGTSIIMDGTFDDDKAYQFTGESVPFAFTNGNSISSTTSADSTFEQITLNGRRTFVYALPVAENVALQLSKGMKVDAVLAGAEEIPLYVTQVSIAGASSKVFVNYPATTSDPTGGSLYTVFASGGAITFGESTSVDLTRPIPLISVRLAPSVDTSVTGKLGEREIINRMQLALKQASITTNKSIEFFLIQNSLPSDLAFANAPSPSLSEVIQHNSGDSLIDGTTIFSSKAAAGSVAVDITELLEIGNSILGGDGIFPAGPDLLTLAVQPQEITDVDFSAPFIVNGKISWSESQA